MGCYVTTAVLAFLLAGGWCLARETSVEPDAIMLSPADKAEDILAKAARVVPSARQLAWQQLEFVAFVHFGMNTFTDREWGDGKEDPKLFSPTQFDARQWVKVCQDAGMKELILTCKHHDGFCLWPSKYTEHSVKNSPWKGGKGDIVREVADACRAAGIKFGVYLSPWDRHEQSYGDSSRYNEYFKNQLRELLSDFGAIAEVWFDGACGEGPNGKRQVYDWPAYYAVVRELQPGAVISVCGPDVRWCGNEAGHVRESEWSVVPIAGADDQPWEKSAKTLNAILNMGAHDGATHKDIGGRGKLLEAAGKSARLIWYPAQVNTSIRPGWFYHAAEDNKVKPLDQLLNIYYGSIGGNAQFLLNLPPDRRGLIHENDAARLLDLRKVLDATFSTYFARGVKATGTDATFEYDLGQPRTFNRALLQEDIKQGQHVEEFFLDAWDGKDWKQLARATVIGYKRLLRFDDVTSQKVRLRITQSRVRPTLSGFGLFYAPPALAAPKIQRDKQGLVSLSAAPGVEIRYWLAGPHATPSSIRYEAPFPLPSGGTIKAIAIPPDGSKFSALSDGALSHEEFVAVAGRDIAANPPIAQGPQPHNAGWTDIKPQPFEPVKRVTDEFPLSDQGNKGGWVKYEPMSDEFNGDKLDEAKWWPCNPTWKGRQPGFFHPGNVKVEGGMLHLTMKKEEVPEMPKAEKYHTYTCAAVQSKDTVRYGYFEVKSRAMKSAGSSSFWFYQQTRPWWTEIDVYEIGGKAPGKERNQHITMHVFHTPNETQHWQVGSAFVAPANLCDDFHVCGLEWDEKELKLYFDGVLVRQGPNTHWHQPLTLNFDSETMPEWFGLPKDEDLPSTFSIEYVRAWKKGAGTVRQGGEK